MRGIYMIINKITGEVYIGQTKNFAQRRTRHLRKLRDKEYRQFNKLYPAMEKYGEENFEFKLIEECAEEELFEKEAQWIEYYKSVEIGYNVLPSAHSGLKYWQGKKRYPETNRKISLALMGNKLPATVRAKIGQANKTSMLGNKNGNKKIVCLDTNQVFISVKSAAESVGVHPSNITCALKGRQKRAGGKRWAYLSSLETIPKGSTAEDELPLEAQDSSRS